MSQNDGTKKPPSKTLFGYQAPATSPPADGEPIKKPIIPGVSQPAAPQVPVGQLPPLGQPANQATPGAQAHPLGQPAASKPTQVEPVASNPTGVPPDPRLPSNFGAQLPPPGGNQEFVAPPPTQDAFAMAPTTQSSAPPDMEIPPGSFEANAMGKLPLSNFAGDVMSKLPSSAAGTIFGIPLNKLRDQMLENKLLKVSGIALLVSIFIPFSTSPTMMSWDLPKFVPLVWPIIAAVVYLFLAFAPASMRANVPAAVLRWVPFLVALIGIGSCFAHVGPAGFAKIMGFGEMEATIGFYAWGMIFLTFGLITRLVDPTDQLARIIIAIGAAMIIPLFLKMLFGEAWEGGAKNVIFNIPWLLVMAVASASIVFAFKPSQFPKLRGVDKFAPLVAAIVIAWMPIHALTSLIQFGAPFVTTLLLFFHSIIFLVAYLGVLMFLAPEAYDEAKGLWQGFQSAGYGEPGQYPPSGQPGQAQQPQQPAAQYQPPGQPAGNPGDGTPHQ